MGPVGDGTGVLICNGGTRGVLHERHCFGVEFENGSMFVAVVELVEFDEGPRAILSVVRLQSLNKILSGLAERSDLIRTGTPRSGVFSILASSDRSAT